MISFKGFQGCTNLEMPFMRSLPTFSFSSYLLCTAERELAKKWLAHRPRLRRLSRWVVWRGIRRLPWRWWIRHLSIAGDWADRCAPSTTITWRWDDSVRETVAKTRLVVSGGLLHVHVHVLKVVERFALVCSWSRPSSDNDPYHASFSFSNHWKK